MFSTRIISFLLALFAFGFLVCQASPIAAREVATRDEEGSLVTVLIDLQVKVVAIVSTFESVTASGGDYSAVVADLVAAVDVAVSACVALGPITVGVQVDVIAKLFVDIFLAIIAVLLKCPLTLINLLLFAKIDLCFCSLISVLQVCIPSIISVIVGLIVDIEALVTLKLSLCIGILGLSI